ncbi:MAG: AsmA-like C-terminal region-containing protein [Gammaproteobacteria bacterium]
MNRHRYQWLAVSALPAGGCNCPDRHRLLENLQGELDFEKRRRGPGVICGCAFWMHPHVWLLRPANRRLILILLAGLTRQRRLGPLVLRLGEYLRGVSDWAIEFKLPKQNRARQNRFELALQSICKVRRYCCPAPLGKVAASARTSHLQLLQEQEQLTVLMRTDADLSSALRLKQSATDWQIQRGTVRIGDELLGGPAELPARNELILQVHLPLYRLASGSSGQSDTGPVGTDSPGLGGAAGLTVFDRSELTLDKLVLGDWQLTDVQLRGQRVADGYHFRLGGTDLAGELFLPQQIGAAEPVHLALKTLHLRRVPDVASQAEADRAADRPMVMSPGVWPALHVNIDTLQLNTQRVGPLLLSVRPLPDGLKLNTLELSAPGQQLSASGEWRTGGAGSRSWLQAKFYSEALGEALALLDIPVSVERAKTALGLDISWPGTLRAPDLAQLRGTLQVHIEEGLLAEIKPGLGRLVGLVNVASLARRLTLDFSDLVETGLAFDQIDGTIDFTGGRASTDDLLLQGPAVNIAVQGWLDLRDQQLQQTVTVMPQIASSLALAGAVAGGPAVGAAVLLAGQVLKPGLEKAVSLRYAVSGTLDTPVIERARITTGGSSGSMSGGGRKYDGCINL